MADLRLSTGPLADPTAEGVRRLAAAAEEHDGIEALGEQTLLSLQAPTGQVVHVVAPPAPDGTAGAGSPRGYAQVDLSAGAGAPATVEVVVEPAERRQGLGSALLDAARTAAQEAGAPGVGVWAHGNLPSAQGLAAHAGLAVRRELWQMALELQPAGEPEPPATPGPGAGPPVPPEGVVVRPFVVGQDEEAWLAVNRRAFAWHPEQGRMTLADLRAREREPWFDPADVLLAEREGRLVASTWMKVEPGSDTGELYVLAVDPEAQGSGLGRFLTAVTLDHLRRKGLPRVVLYTEASNAAAVRTYGAAGFRRVRVDVQYG